MNYQFKYYPEPGITYDIIRMLYVKLNANSIWKETLTTVDCQEEHISFIEEHAGLLPEPDPDLALFAYIPTNRKTTFLSSIVDELISNNFSSYTLNSLYEYINDISRVKDGIFTYYFYDEFIDSTDFEYQLRVNRTIPDRIKLLLFGFSYNPTAFIKKLNTTIQEYYTLIKKLWKEVSVSTEMLKQFSSKLFSEKLLVKIESDSNITEEVRYSLCRCTPMYLISGCSQNNLFFISTQNTIQESIRTEIAYSTSELIQAIHSIDDQYRLEILHFLKNSPEQSPL